MDGMSADEMQKWISESVEYKALQYFLDPENANCEALESNIVIFSAGNLNNPASMYPGAMKDFISVTAICNDFLPGGYSNYGGGCDIAAPGGDISEKDSQAPCMILSTGISMNGGMSYIYKYGTSMACPHVSGVAALGASYALRLGKKFSREEFISKLLSSANPIDNYITDDKTKLTVGDSGNYETVDLTIKKGKMGAGAVDAWNFLMALEGTPSYMATPGQKLAITVGEGYSLEIDAKDAEALGIEGTPEVKNGILEVTCTKIGSGKIRFKASVGKDENGVIPELDYYKYISIVSRPAVAANGGWL
jgi:subtilisin family serine protease